jgi:hypothetical protein
MTLSARPLPGTPGAAVPPLPLRSARPYQRLATWWRGITGRRGRYADLRARLGLEPRERLLATGAAPAGGYALAASDRALYYRDVGAWSRLGWEQVTRVDWEPAGRLLVITGLAGTGLAGTGLAGTGRTRTAVPLRERGHLPEIAAERIGFTRLGSWRVVLPGGQRLALVARRQPGTDELLWFVFCAGDSLDLRAGDQRAQVQRVIARLAAESGLTRRPAGGLPPAWPAAPVTGRPRSGGRAAGAG